MNRNKRLHLKIQPYQLDTAGSAISVIRKELYSNDALVALTRELTETLRKNRTIDWQMKETARATMRKMIKRLLKKHKYPPEGMEDALETVMSQCEMWTDNAVS